MPFSPRETAMGLWGQLTDVSHRQVRAFRPLRTLCGTCDIEKRRSRYRPTVIARTITASQSPVHRLITTPSRQSPAAGSRQRDQDLCAANASLSRRSMIDQRTYWLWKRPHGERRLGERRGNRGGAILIAGATHRVGIRFRGGGAGCRSPVVAARCQLRRLPRWRWRAIARRRQKARRQKDSN